MQGLTGDRLPRVKPTEAIARQHLPPMRVIRSGDWYMQHGIKFPAIGFCPSYPALLWMALLEGTAAVTSYIPRPYQFWIGEMRHYPTFYVLEGGRRILQDLWPDGIMPEHLEQPLREHLNLQNQELAVISSATVLAREQEALNWLHIVRSLVIARDLDTSAAEQTIWNACTQGEPTLGDFIDVGHRHATYLQEIALYRLLHRGKLQADLTIRPLHYDTVVHTCT